MHFLKYITIISPDLLLSVLASWWVQTVSAATPKTYTRNEVGHTAEHIDHEIKYVKYKVVYPQGAVVYNIPSYDPSTEKVYVVDKGDIVETTTDMPAHYVETTDDSGKKVKWIQLISKGNGWTPLRTPS